MTQGDNNPDNAEKGVEVQKKLLNRDLDADRLDSFTQWFHLQCLTKESPILNKREECFFRQVIEITERYGWAPRLEVYESLKRSDSKFFPSQNSVEEVEKKLLEMNVLRIVKESGGSGDYLRYDDDFAKIIQAGFARQDGRIEFIDDIPNSRTVFVMEGNLDYLIRQRYRDISEKEVVLIKRATYYILDEKYFAILPIELVYQGLVFGGEKFSSWEEAEASVKGLVEKKILIPISAGLEWEDGNKMMREFPRPHLMLNPDFARDAISLLNFTYTSQLKRKKFSTTKRQYLYTERGKYEYH